MDVRSRSRKWPRTGINRFFTSLDIFRVSTFWHDSSLWRNSWSFEGCIAYREWLPPVEENAAVGHSEEDVVQEWLRCRRVDPWKYVAVSVNWSEIRQNV